MSRPNSKANENEFNDMSYLELRDYILTMQNNNPSSPWYEDGYLITYAKNLLTSKRYLETKNESKASEWMSPEEQELRDDAFDGVNPRDASQHWWSNVSQGSDREERLEWLKNNGYEESYADITWYQLPEQVKSDLDVSVQSFGNDSAYGYQLGGESKSNEVFTKVSDFFENIDGNFSGECKLCGDAMVQGEYAYDHLELKHGINIDTLTLDFSGESKASLKAMKASGAGDMIDDIPDGMDLDEWLNESKANEEIEYTGGDYCGKCGTEFEDKGECKKCDGESKASESISDSDKQILGDWVSQNRDWTTIDDLPDDIFVPLMTPFGDDIDKRVEAQVEIIKYMKSLGESNIGAESWSQASSINRIEALERVGVKQGDAIKLSSLEFEDFGEDLQGALKGDVEDARKDMQQGVKSLNQLGDYNPNDSEDGKKVGLPHQYGEEVENPNSEFGQSYPDYNNIGESQTNMTSYECELCDSGFRSNEALSVHHNDKHAIAPESFDGYASEIGMHGGDGASFYDGKTFTCDKCGKVGNSFSDMAQEECPADVNANHQIPIFGDQVKPRGIGESKASEDITFADQHRGIQKDMIEFIRRRGGSVSELDIDRKFDLLNNFDNESMHLQALVNDGTLTMGGWQPDNSGNDGYTDGSYLYNLNESLASEDFGNAQQKWNSLGWMGRSNVLKKVGLDNISPDTNVWELNSNDWDIISAELIDYDTESKASEYGDAIHSEDGNGWDQGGFFFGIPNMTRDDYEGTVYWKGTPVEHYDHDYFGGDGFEQDMEKDARRLAEKCKDLESRGITPTTSSILSGESKSNEAGSEDHMCAECGFVTSDNSEYLDHLNSHEE
jgi:hypothetical protein